MEKTGLIVFQDKKIRRLWINEQWYFSVVDVVGVLVDSPNPRKYWNKLSQRLKEESNESVTFCHQLKLPASEGKYYETDCVNIEGLFRIIQSIPSPKSELFKQWLAKVGYKRVQEIENPELAQARMREIYRTKGYSDSGIEKRISRYFIAHYRNHYTNYYPDHYPNNYTNHFIFKFKQKNENNFFCVY